MKYFVPCSCVDYVSEESAEMNIYTQRGGSNMRIESSACVGP